MLVLVNDEASCIPVRLGADGAGIRTHLRVDGGVLSQRIRVWEECAADAAYVWFLSSVDAHVLHA